MRNDRVRMDPETRYRMTGFVLSRDCRQADPEELAGFPKEQIVCALAADRNNASWFRRLSPEQKRDPEIADAAVRGCPRTYKELPIEARTPERTLIAVRHDGSLLIEAPEASMTPEVCMAAVKGYGPALEWVPDHLKTKEMCMEAVQQNALALQFVPDSLKTPYICLEARRHDSMGHAVKYIPEQWREAIDHTLKSGELLPTHMHRQTAANLESQQTAQAKPAMRPSAEMPDFLAELAGPAKEEPEAMRLSMR